MSESFFKVPRVESNRPPRRRTSPLGCALFLLVLFVLVIKGCNPMNSQKASPESSAVQTSRTLALALFAYANNHNGNYPDGKSSTEVFQKLLDERCITDPSILYVSSPGKVRAAQGQKILKPENVCYDTTAGLTSKSPDELPLVFLTGYKMPLAPGAAAVPVIKPHPKYCLYSWFGVEYADFNGIAVTYWRPNSQGQFFSRFTVWDADFSIPNFVPPDFKPDGHVYRQLTPDGSL